MRLSYLANVVTLSYDAVRCIGCGRCTEVCPHAVFVLDEGKARVADRDSCMECGACSRNCPVDALKVFAGTGCAAAYLPAWLSGGECACECRSDSTNSTPAREAAKSPCCK